MYFQSCFLTAFYCTPLRLILNACGLKKLWSAKQRTEHSLFRQPHLFNFLKPVCAGHYLQLEQRLQVMKRRDDSRHTFWFDKRNRECKKFINRTMRPATNTYSMDVWKSFVCHGNSCLLCKGALQYRCDPIAFWPNLLPCFHPRARLFPVHIIRQIVLTKKWTKAGRLFYFFAQPHCSACRRFRKTATLNNFFKSPYQVNGEL